MQEVELRVDLLYLKRDILSGSGGKKSKGLSANLRMRAEHFLRVL